VAQVTLVTFIMKSFDYKKNGIKKPASWIAGSS